MTDTVGRLAGAASKAFQPVLALGFRVVPGPASGRGESVDLLSDLVAIRVLADWLEGVIAVELQALGGPAVPLASVVDTSRARGLHLQRIPRGVTAGQLEATLGKVAALLVTQASEVLAGTAQGLTRLRL